MKREQILYQEEKETIASLTKSNPKKALLLSKKLKKKVREDHNELEIAYADYYIASSELHLEHCEKCVDIISNITHVFKKYQQKDWIHKCYNLRGVANIMLGDNEKALSDFLLASSYCVKRSDRLLTQNNIGILYYNLHSYEDAYRYFKKCYDQTIRYYTKTNSNLALPLFICQLNLADVLGYLGKYEDAMHYIDEIEEMSSTHEDIASDLENNKLSFILCKAKLYFGMANLKEALDASEQIDQLLQAQYINWESYIDLQDIIPLLTRYGFLDMAQRLLDKVYKNAQKVDKPAFWIGYYTCAIDYYKASQNIAVLLDCYDQYFYYAKLKTIEDNKKFVRDIQTKLSLEKALEKQKATEEKAEKMRLLSETDALTGILNRLSLNKLCEKMFLKSQQNGTSIGLILFDVDYFKEYNDTYGHVAGDTCLQTVAKILNSFSDSKHFVARYGGDEFLLMALEQTDQEMQSLAEKIRVKIYEENLTHIGSHLPEKRVSLSMGVTNHIPSMSETIMDRIQYTDQALYEAKHTRRGSIHFNKSYHETFS